LQKELHLLSCEREREDTQVHLKKEEAPKKRGGVTFETPHEESEGRNLRMIISPKDRLLF
jgi:hypothetical protein